MLSRLLLRLYRWSLRHSGPQGTSIEYEHTMPVPVKTEYIGMFPKTQVVNPGNVMFGWVDVGPKNTPRHRRHGLFRGR